MNTEAGYLKYVIVIFYTGIAINISCTGHK